LPWLFGPQIGQQGRQVQALDRAPERAEALDFKLAEYVFAIRTRSAKLAAVRG
jgi:hypothetical protein